MIASMTSAREAIGKRDIAIAVVVSALGVLLMYANIVDPADPNNPDQSAWLHVGNILPREFAIPLFLLVTVPLLWRRVNPIAATTAAFAGLLVNELLLGTEFVRCGVLLPTTFLLSFAAGSRLDGRDARTGLLLTAGLTGVATAPELGPITGAVMVAGTAVMWGIGRVVRSRGRLADELEERTHELRQARDERARLEVATDRARLSGELDELLHRRLGELARLAGEHPEDDPEAVTATLVDIEHKSRRTLEEMRGLVGVLRDDGSEAITEPQPTLTHLEALLTRTKGAEARLAVEGDPRVLPPAIELSVYRIVEHLLGALADSSEVEVQVRFGEDAIELSVSGPARRRPDAAIERARERVQLHRGTLRTSARRGRAATVVELPVLVEV